MIMIQTIKNWFLPVKYAYQRVVRGYDDRLFWSLADYVDPMIVAHVKYLREEGCGHPANVTLKKWNKVLDTILAGFGSMPEAPSSKKDWRKYFKNRDRALVLLVFYWDNLWD